MKKPRRALFVFGFTVIITPLLVGRSPAQELPPLVLTEVGNQTTASVIEGQIIQVNLHGNVTTGYYWVLTRLDGDSVQTNGAPTYTVDPGGGVGVGGTFSFLFLASKPGNTTLALDYRRAGDATPAKTFAVTLQVITNPSPRLTLSRAGPNMVISWPIEGSQDFFLEGSQGLSPVQWAALNVLPIRDGTNYSVTLGLEGDALFFRLRPNAAAHIRRKIEPSPTMYNFGCWASSLNETM